VRDRPARNLFFAHGSIRRKTKYHRIPACIYLP
jgi:hypothetical protein